MTIFSVIAIVGHGRFDVFDTFLPVIIVMNVIAAVVYDVRMKVGIGPMSFV